jgi:hypothetical protein
MQVDSSGHAVADSLMNRLYRANPGQSVHSTVPVGWLQRLGTVGSGEAGPAQGAAGDAARVEVEDIADHGQAHGPAGVRLGGQLQTGNGSGAL